MGAPAWVLTLDASEASAAFGAAVLRLGPSGALLECEGDRTAVLERLSRACARRGLTVEPQGEALLVDDRSVALICEPPPAAARARLRGQQVELVRAGTTTLGERPELLAAAPLFEAFERGASLRWALQTTIFGRDEWTARVDLSERRPQLRIDAALQRWFPGLVGRVGVSAAVGPQLGAALHLSVVLGAGASLESVRDLLAAQADDARSRWPRLRERPGFGSADCLGDPGLTLDPDALTSAGPLVRIVGYFDPPAILAGDLLRRLQA